MRNEITRMMTVDSIAFGLGLAAAIMVQEIDIESLRTLAIAGSSAISHALQKKKETDA